MIHTRRDWNLLFPALLAAPLARASYGAPAAAVLPSKIYPFDELPVKVNNKNGNQTREVFDGATHQNVPIDLHLTTLQPGQMPHPPHQHAHEEIVMMETGTLEVTIGENTRTIGPGSVAFVMSNQRHGWKNPGSTPATYFVFAIGKEPETKAS